jgi:hypothetical protein
MCQFLWQKFTIEANRADRLEATRRNELHLHIILHGAQCVLSFLRFYDNIITGETYRFFGILLSLRERAAENWIEWTTTTTEASQRRAAEKQLVDLVAHLNGSLRDNYEMEKLFLFSSCDQPLVVVRFSPQVSTFAQIASSTSHLSPPKICRM